METMSAALTLFLIMDPLGNIPLFLALLKDLPPGRQRVVMARELVIANRTVATAQALARQFAGHGRLTACGYADLAHESGFDPYVARSPPPDARQTPPQPEHP